MVVVGAGTGGTVAGIGRKFKENMPNVQVWGEGRGEEEEGMSQLTVTIHR